MRAIRSLVLFCLLGLLAAACLPVTTTVPAGTSVGLAADPALIGTWRGLPDKTSAGGHRGNDEMPYLHILSAGKTADGKAQLKAAMVTTGTPRSPAGGDISLYAATTTVLGGRHLLNIRILYGSTGPASAADQAKTIPALYRFDGPGRLIITLIDETAAKAAIAAGKIAGTIENGDYGDVTLTADGAGLDAYLASADGAKLFVSNPMRFVRVRGD